VARVVGQKEFWSLPFRLSSETLTPRPETETVVEAALAAFPHEDARLSVLDLGTGAGILLAAVLAERPYASGVAVDRSEGALAMAHANLQSLGLGERARFVAGDWGAALAGMFDLVVCNPPYVAAHEFEQLPLDVRKHDPHLALDGGEDGLDAYRALIPDLGRLLNGEGVAVLELGRGQEPVVAELARAAGLVVSAPARPDLAGIPRALALHAGHKKTLGRWTDPH
jgi:release factor glutamine methyltransferase